MPVEKIVHDPKVDHGVIGDPPIVKGTESEDEESH
jgi:hypothetical protein